MPGHVPKGMSLRANPRDALTAAVAAVDGGVHLYGEQRRSAVAVLLPASVWIVRADIKTIRKQGSSCCYRERVCAQKVKPKQTNSNLIRMGARPSPVDARHDALGDAHIVAALGEAHHGYLGLRGGEPRRPAVSCQRSGEEGCCARSKPTERV